MAKGILFVLMEPVPINEEEFNDWYDLEHVPERAAVPGFEVLQRYVCTAGFRVIWHCTIWNRPMCWTATRTERSVAKIPASGPNGSPGLVRGHYRMSGMQLYPGDRVTELVEGQAKRLTAIICRGMDETSLVERASWQDADDGRVRLYRNEEEVGDHLFLIEHAAATGGTGSGLVAALEEMTPGGVVTVNQYAAYWRRDL